MKKKIIAIVLSALTVASALSMPVFADDVITVLVNGEQVTFTDVAPYIEEGRTLVPMRTIFETLGAVVEWDGETKTIISYDPVSNVSITMQADSKTMFINEEPVELDVPATIVGDRTVVPLRAIAEGMNSNVGWDQDTKTVTIEKNINN